MYQYKTKGVCSRAINIDVQDGVIRSVDFEGGCTGNLSGISALIEGMKVEDAIQKMRGIQCRNGTSCPDQLSRALEKLIKEGA